MTSLLNPLSFKPFNVSNPLSSLSSTNKNTSLPSTIKLVSKVSKFKVLARKSLNSSLFILSYISCNTSLSKESK